jgi:hypothetical protein
VREEVEDAFARQTGASDQNLKVSALFGARGRYLVGKEPTTETSHPVTRPPRPLPATAESIRVNYLVATKGSY